MAMAHLRKEKIPIHVAFSFERLTNGTAGVRLWIGLDKSHLTRKVGARGSFYSVRLFGRVTGPRGRIVQQFENRFSNPEQRSDLFDTQDKIVTPQSLSLSPGEHQLFLVVDDSFGNEVGTWEGILPVPDPGEMSESSLVIGDRVGSHRLRTRVLESDFPVQPRFQSDKTSLPCFRPGEELAIWMQLYRLDVNKSASMIAEFRIVNDRTKKVMFEEGERPFVREQVSLSKSIALSGFDPGTYILEVNIRGPITRTFSRSFRVTSPTGATLGTFEP